MQRSRVEPETASLQLTTRTTNLITLGMFLVFTRSPHCIVSTEDKSVSIRGPFSSLVVNFGGCGGAKKP